MVVVNIILQTIVPMCVTALVTLAITMIFKTSFTTNFAQGVLSAFGAYVITSVIAKVVASDPMNANLSSNAIWIALPLGMLASMALAVFMDVVIFRRGRYVNALGKQIITMGMISLLTGGIALIFGRDFPKLQSFASGRIELFGDIAITKHALICLIITVVVITAIFLLLRFSKWGLSVRATASNEYVAGMMGINTHIVTAVSWGLAGALGALAATMNGGGNTVSPYFMTQYQVNAFLAGILGGFATFYGPVIVAALIPLVSNLIVLFGNTIGVNELSSWSMVIIYALALVIIFFKPNGIFGKKIVKKV